MYENISSLLLLWMTLIGLGAMLWSLYETQKLQKETDRRIAEINRELKRRAASAE